MSSLPRAPAVSAAVVCLLAAACPAWAGTTTRWDAVSGAVDIVDEPGLARTSDGALHLAWAQGAPGGRVELLQRSVAPGGTLNPIAAIVRNWTSLSSPELLAAPNGSLRAVWEGQRSAPPIADGYVNIATATASPSGSSWALDPVRAVTDASLTQGAAVGAATGRDGTPFLAWAPGPSVMVHRGIGPGAPDVDVQTPLGLGCCGYHPDLAADSVTGEVWVSWLSNAGSRPGIFVQAIDPATGGVNGAPIRLTGTYATSNGSVLGAVESVQRVSISGRAGRRLALIDGARRRASYPYGTRAFPGVYLAAAAGYPTARRVLLWRAGSRSPTTIFSSTRAARFASVAGDPNGRLWVVWSMLGGRGAPFVFARRSNVAATRFGATVRLGGPLGSTDIWHLRTDAQGGRLDVVGSFTNHAVVRIWHAQVLPGLDIVVRPVRPGQQSVTVRVLDAGDPVAGARVTVSGHSAATGRGGRATIELGTGARRGVLTIGAGHAGYTTATAGLRVGR